MVKQLQLFRAGPMVEVPRLSARQRAVLGELEVLECRGKGQVGGFEQARSGLTGILRALIRKGCIQVMGVSPARYRITRLGRVARRVG